MSGLLSPQVLLGKVTSMANVTATSTSAADLCRQPTNTSFVAQACFLIVIAITTLLGNLSVCLTVFFNSSLHTFTSYLVASLACSDLMVATFSLPFRIHQTLHNTRWCLSEKTCVFWIWADLFCCCASIGNLALISIDRFLATKYPLRYHQIMTRRTSWFMLSSVWIYSLIVSSSGLTNWTFPGGALVGINNGCYKPDPYFYTFAAVFGFFFPLLVIICAYCYIFKTAMHHFRAISRLTTSVLPNVPQSTETQQTIYKQQLKATKTLAIVVGAFVICWLPTFIIILVQMWCQTCLKNQPDNPKMHGLFYFINIAFVYTLPNINSAINPFIYVIFSKDLRQAFIKTFRSLYQELCDIRARTNLETTSLRST